jgi:hypothetical protein
MEIFIILALVVAVILIVGYPLVNPLRYREQAGSLATQSGNEELYGKREIVFEALRDLQFEFATGKLSAADYEQLKGQYELQAAEVIRQVDALKPTKPRSGQGTRACARCGSSMHVQDKFCTKCGAKL